MRTLQQYQITRYQMVEAIATEFEEEGFHFEDSNLVFEHESIRP